MSWSSFIHSFTTLLVLLPFRSVFFRISALCVQFQCILKHLEKPISWKYTQKFPGQNQKLGVRENGAISAAAGQRKRTRTRAVCVEALIFCTLRHSAVTVEQRPCPFHPHIPSDMMTLATMAAEFIFYPAKMGHVGEFAIFVLRLKWIIY
jgi:hypothetical protein